jgi:hypothetical protein
MSSNPNIVQKKKKPTKIKFFKIRFLGASKTSKKIKFNVSHHWKYNNLEMLNCQAA